MWLVEQKANGGGPNKDERRENIMCVQSVEDGGQKLTSQGHLCDVSLL